MRQETGNNGNFLCQLSPEKPRRTIKLQPTIKGPRKQFELCHEIMLTRQTVVIKLLHTSAAGSNYLAKHKP